MTKSKEEIQAEIARLEAAGKTNLADSFRELLQRPELLDETYRDPSPRYTNKSPIEFDDYSEESFP